MALILLITQSASKVHLVYDSQHLMQRDQKQFAQWWVIFKLECAVEYHIGTNFAYQPGEILLIDEADEFIFNSPSEFLSKIQPSCCICLTATPHNQKTKGIE